MFNEEWVLKSQRILAVKLRNFRDDFVWVMANVYGPIEDRERESFSNALSGVSAQWSVLCCYGGDFNIIRYPHEKKRGRYISSSMARFSEFINDHELVDLLLIGRGFTWSNNQERVAMSRIDRFLLSKEWEDHFPRVIQSAMPRGMSDHCPIKLSSNMVDWGLKPRFWNCWLTHKEFLPMVKNWWLQSETQRYAGFIIFKILQELKGRIKVWVNEVFGISNTIRDLLAQEVEG